MEEGRKRVIGLMAAILSAMHMQRADDLFGMPNGSPITDRIIEASIQWAERIRGRGKFKPTSINFGNSAVALDRMCLRRHAESDLRKIRGPVFQQSNRIREMWDSLLPRPLFFFLSPCSTFHVFTPGSGLTAPST